MAGFQALVLTERDGKVSAGLETRSIDELPPGDVLARIRWSTLNYKDGLILAGLGRLVRAYPHIPGIDFAGIVEDSSNPAWRKGDEVILTGWRVGEQRWGGYAELARVPAAFLVRPPAGLSLRHAMALGTAGFTAMLAVLALERQGLVPEAGDVLVTGAGGGVGSVAVALLAGFGYRVTASSGRQETHELLRRLGAAEIIDRAALATPPTRPLQTERWAGAVDAVGGSTLSTLLTQMQYRASIAACGLAGGAELATTLMPFLLRGVNLLGIDSVMAPHREREAAWARLASGMNVALLDALTETIRLDALPEYGRRILAGQVRGRVLVEIGA
jgi:acrylyl-CoA reductase (NADPH)